MSQIDAAIFDIGNVLAMVDYGISARRLLERNKLASPPAKELLAAIQIAYETGEIDRAEFVRQLSDAYLFDGTEEDFVAIWQDIFVPNTPLHRMVESLAPRIPIYLLSNIGDIHHRHLFRIYPVFGLFRDGVYSYLAGVMKPDPRIFEIAAEQFGVTPGRTLYLDDLPEHVASARSRGFLAFQYDAKNHTQIEAKVLRLLED